MLVIAITAIIAFLVDRISKFVMVNYVFNIENLRADSVAETVPIIKDVFHFSYHGNTGMAFGMMSDSKLLLIGLCILILLVIGIIIYKTKPQKLIAKLGYGLIIGGAIGNLADRIAHGFVIDFLDFRIINYPVFNIADCCVVVGAVFLCVYFVFFDKKEDKVEKN